MKFVALGLSSIKFSFNSNKNSLQNIWLTGWYFIRLTCSCDLRSDKNFKPMILIICRWYFSSALSFRLYGKTRNLLIQSFFRFLILLGRIQGATTYSTITLQLFHYLNLVFDSVEYFRYKISTKTLTVSKHWRTSKTIFMATKPKTVYKSMCIWKINYLKTHNLSVTIFQF